MEFDASIKILPNREKLKSDQGVSVLWMKYGNPRCYMCPSSQQNDICSSICMPREELS